MKDSQSKSPNLASTSDQNTSSQLPNFDSSYEELGPNEKGTPRKIPFLKIVLSILVFGILTAILITAIYFVKHQDKYLEIAQPASQQAKAILSPYPSPDDNICGYEAKICPGGDVTVKNGIKCEFITCPENSSDMTKFWNISSSTQQKRTYENLDLKYNFPTPSNWKFIGNDHGFILYSPNFSCKTTNECVGSAIQLTSSLTTGKEDIEQWYKSDENIIAKNSGKNPSNLNNFEINTINGIKAIFVKDRNNARTLYFINDSVVYILSIKSSSDNDFINGNKVFANIISSFKFEESTREIN